MGGSMYTEKQVQENQVNAENDAAEKELDKELEGAAPTPATPEPVTVPNAPIPEPVDPAPAPQPQKSE